MCPEHVAVLMPSMTNCARTSESTPNCHALTDVGFTSVFQKSSQYCSASLFIFLSPFVGLKIVNLCIIRFFVTITLPKKLHPYEMFSPIFHETLLIMLLYVPHF